MGIEALRDLLLWIMAIACAMAFLGFVFYMLWCKWKRRHLFRGHLPEQACDVDE